MRCARCAGWVSAREKRGDAESVAEGLALVGLGVAVSVGIGALLATLFGGKR